MNHEQSSSPETQIALPRGLIVLIGPPGSGKSTFARELVRAGVVDAQAVVSSDAIGAELFGEYDSERDGEIFAERDQRIRQRLANEQVTIADSTNVNPRDRRRLLDLAESVEMPTTALRLDAQLETAIRQDRDRDKSVEEIERYHRLMNETAFPDALKAEGFDAVFDVPGADQGITPAHAARLFRIARPPMHLKKSTARGRASGPVPTDVVK